MSASTCPELLEERIATLEQTVAELRAMVDGWVVQRQERCADPENAVATVLRIVSNRFFVSAPAIRSHVRQRQVVLARWMTFHLLVTRFHLSQNRVAQLIGRDHAGISHALHQLPSFRQQSRSLALAATAAERDLDELLEMNAPKVTL